MSHAGVSFTRCRSHGSRRMTCCAAAARSATECCGRVRGAAGGGAGGRAVGGRGACRAAGGGATGCEDGDGGAGGDAGVGLPLKRGAGGAITAGGETATPALSPPPAFSRSASRRCTSRSCSSESSIDEPQRQQSATISQKRIDIGARQSGQAQKIDSPSSQISPACRFLPPGECAGEGPAAGPSSGNGWSPERSHVGIGAAGRVGKGGWPGASSGRKSKPISCGPKACANSES